MLQATQRKQLLWKGPTEVAIFSASNTFPPHLGHMSGSFSMARMLLVATGPDRDPDLPLDPKVDR